MFNRSLALVIGACVTSFFLQRVALAAKKGKDSSTCNISSFISSGGRYRRSSGKQGVMVCITAKPGIEPTDHKSPDKHHNHDDETSDDDSSSNESSPTHSNNDSEDDSDDSDEDSNSHNKEKNNGKNRPQGNPGNDKSSSSRLNKGRKRDLRVIVDEQFSYRNWSSEWISAKNANGSEIKVYNKFSRVYARKSNHSRPNYGIITSNKGGEFYMIATSFAPFNNRNETLVIQFSVQFQSRAHCQLAFLRLYDCQFSTDDFTTQTPYIMQVGPHICGTTRVNRVSAEFQEPGKTTIKKVDRSLEPINNTSVNTYALALEPDGTYHIIINTNATQNGTLKDVFHNYKGYTGICAAGLLVWHSVLDKYFKGQIIIDDILVVNDLKYAEKKRKQILNLYSEN